MNLSIEDADLFIDRFCYSEIGVFGEMLIDGQRIYTVEKPWRGNQPSVSCIPTGAYTCKPRRYNRGGYDAIEICDVPDRTHILFHKANVASQLAGCIAPGYRLGCLHGAWAVLNSAQAFKLLMEQYGGLEFRLGIRDIRGHEP
jgi:hypothetical protein